MTVLQLDLLIINSPREENYFQSFELDTLLLREHLKPQESQRNI